MAELMQIRQRINAIATIKKITHAMRLISMSSHTRLKTQEQSLTTYTKAIATLFNKAKSQISDWHNPVLQPLETEQKSHLVILVGSDKGLCGNFNTTLFYFFEEYLPSYNLENTIFIAIGKKAIDYLEQKKKIIPSLVYRQFTANSLPTITQALIDHISLKPTPYTSVTIFSNVLKSFFQQKPERTQLIPFQAPESSTQDTQTTDFYFEQPGIEVINFLAEQVIKGTLEYLLFQSLISEQAARFISMDSSTRNADRLLEQTKLLYNKLRQATITKELAELTGNM